MPNPLFRTAPATESKPRQSSSVRLVDAETRTFEFDAKPEHISSKLTNADIEGMQRIGLANVKKAASAKSLYCSNVPVKDWPKKVGLSLSYCKKLSAIFGRG